MPNPLSQAGATVEPSEYATLAQDEQFTGMWTQRNPLRDADVPYLYRKFYSASRIDSIIDGINREISANLTDRRRPGSSVFNANVFPPGYSFYSFKWVQNQAEILRLMYDGKDGNIYDATAGQISTLMSKSSATARARFLSVGTTLYVGDGGQVKKVVRSPITWQANTTFTTDQFIVDSNGNLQLAMGAQTATIVAVQVTAAHPLGHVVTLFFDPSTPLNIEDNIALTLAGMTTVPTLNGTTPADAVVISPTQVQFVGLFSGVPNTPFSAETGTATTGTGITGGSQPAWASAGLATQDGTQQWVNLGSSVQNWGGAAPTTAPIVTQVPAATLDPTWAASTWYAPAGAFIIVDSNSNLQLLTTAGTTGGAPPVWAVGPGTTTDGSAIWTFKGSGAWVSGATHAVGDLIVVTFTYYTTSTFWDAGLHMWVTQTVPNTVTNAFLCTAAGISGANQPGWTNGLNTVTIDGSVSWLNKGNPPSWPGATQVLSLASTIVDSLGNLQVVQNLGESGAAAPTWQTAKGATTIDNAGAHQISWLNNGPYSPANTGAWYWAYSGLNTITNEITNPSPISQPLIVTAGMSAVVQGSGLADSQFDQIILWRTAQNGSELFYDSQFANPGAGAPWIFTDTTPDNANGLNPFGLNVFMAAPGSILTSSLCTPPPATLTALEFHCGRIVGIDGAFVRWSGGPDTTVGNGNSAFPPLNFFELPEQPIRLKSVTMNGSGGLLIFTTANTYVMLGEGTQDSPFIPPKMFMEGVGILSYDCIAMRGSTIYGFSNRYKAFSFDPGNGEIEIGFPIGDQLQFVTTGGISSALYNPATSYVTWHEKNSGDTALYVADGAVGWFRFSPVAPPESGNLWSPRAAIVGGTSAVQSVETSTGTFNLLIAPPSSGPILQRDTSVFRDNGAAYPSWDVKGSIGLCETGEVAEIAHIALKSIAVGSRPIVSLLLDEIKPGVTVGGRTSAWDQLSLDDGHSEDPPNLEPSITMYSDRYRTSSTAMCPKCENFQLKIDYGTQAFADELLKFAVYGATFKERRQQ